MDMMKITGPMQRADRREQIMKVARRMVAKEGIGALTMMALAEQARVAKPVIYSHFPNRAAVAIALLDEHFVAVTEYVRSRIKKATTLAEYCSHLVDAAFEFESLSDAPVRKITNGFSADEEVNEAYLRHEQTFRRHWVQLLPQFGVPLEVVDVVAYALSGMVDNAVYTYAITRKRKAARETLKAMLFGALSALTSSTRRKAKIKPVFDTDGTAVDMTQASARKHVTPLTGERRPRRRNARGV
jgi:AcrR family transcriptional regulator